MDITQWIPYTLLYEFTKASTLDLTYVWLQLWYHTNWFKDHCLRLYRLIPKAYNAILEAIFTFTIITPRPISHQQLQVVVKLSFQRINPWSYTSLNSFRVYGQSSRGSRHILFVSLLLLKCSLHIFSKNMCQLLQSYHSLLKSSSCQIRHHGLMWHMSIEILVLDMLFLHCFSYFDST